MVKLAKVELEIALASLTSSSPSHSESGNAAVSAIEYALELNSEEGMQFLRLWFHGEFDIIRHEYKAVPDSVFIGADPLFKKQNITA